MKQQNDSNSQHTENGDVLDAATVKLLADNQISYDPTTNDCYDADGNRVSPSVVSAVVRMAENPPTGSDWHKGLDALNLDRASSPNALGQAPPEHPGVGVPPSAFTMPGSSIDSDGQAGQPAERNAAHPDYADAIPTSGSTMTGSGPMMAERLTQVRQAGDSMLAGAPTVGTVLPSSAIKARRDGVSGQYVNAPCNRDHVASHDVRGVDPSTATGGVASFGAQGAPNNPNGPTPGAAERSVAPTVRPVDSETLKEVSS